MKIIDLSPLVIYSKYNTTNNNTKPGKLQLIANKAYLEIEFYDQSSICLELRKTTIDRQIIFYEIEHKNLCNVLSIFLELLAAHSEEEIDITEAYNNVTTWVQSKIDEDMVEEIIK